MDAPPNPNDRPIKPHKCEGCWKPASSGIKLFQCARCHKFGYCSRACQAWDWITAPTLTFGMRRLPSSMLDQMLLYDLNLHATLMEHRPFWR